VTANHTFHYSSVKNQAVSINFNLKVTSLINYDEHKVCYGRLDYNKLTIYVHMHWQLVS